MAALRTAELPAMASHVAQYPTRHGTLLVSLWPARRATAAYWFRGDFVDVVEEIVRDLPGVERLHMPQRAIEVGDYNNE